jgi:hypothetical protein
MRIKHYTRDYLFFIGKVVDITTVNGKKLKNVLILDVGIEEEVIFYQENVKDGKRGYIKQIPVQVQETDEKPFKEVTKPTTLYDSNEAD